MNSSGVVLALGVALAAGGLAAPAPARAQRSVYAIIVGNNRPPEGDEQLAPLRYADDDALRYFELFGRAGRHTALLTVLDAATQRRYAGRVPPAQPPTLAELRRSLAGFVADMERDRERGEQPVLFVTYSGHGAQDELGQPYLSFLDGGLTQQILYDEVLAPLSDTEVHLIVDACNAGGVVGARGGAGSETEAQVVALSDEQRRSIVAQHSLSRFPLAGALIASNSGQETHEWSRVEAGVFSHEVLSALLGGADVNGDLRVEYSEVLAFVMASNQAVRDPRAVPRVLVHPPVSRPHALLIDLAALEGTRYLTGSGDEVARMSLIMPDGHRLMDVHLRGTHRAVLALPDVAGIYARRDDREAEIPTGSSIVPVASLHFAPSEALARGQLDRTLRDALFAAEFSVDYYRGVADSQDLMSVDFSAPPRLLPAPLVAPPAMSSAGRPGPVDATQPVPGWVSPVLLGASGAALITAAATFVVALNAKADFDRTDQMREARELSDRYQTNMTVAVSAAIVSAGSGVAAWLLWPDEAAEREAR